MSIASILARLRAARDAQAAALVAKGVQVPDGAGFEDFPALTAAIPSGGSAAVYSGSFIPAENVLKVTIDIGGEYSHFAMYAESSVTGFGVKSTAGAIIDKTIPAIFGMATNNSGASGAAYFSSYRWNENEGLPFFQVNNSQISVGNNSVTITTASPTGTCFGYFIADVKYNWFAW